MSLTLFYVLSVRLSMKYAGGNVVDGELANNRVRMFIIQWQLQHESWFSFRVLFQDR